MLARVGAILASVLLILGALWFRNRPELGEVVCDPLIAEACREAFGSDATISEPATVLARVIEGDVEPFVWITAQAWIEMAHDPTVNRSGSRPGSVEPVASTPLVVASTNGACLAWTCLSDALVAGEKVGLDRLTTSSGVTTAAYLIDATYGSGADSSIKESDLVRALTNPQVAVGTVRAPAAITMATRPGRFTVSATTQSVWAPVVRPEFSGQSAGGDLVVVASPFGGSSSPSVAGVRDALVEAGWEPASGDAADLPISAGLLWSVAVDS